MPAFSFTAIGEWAANASGQVLTALSASRAPCESTIRRVVVRLDGDELGHHDRYLGCGTYSASVRQAVAIDGKTPRGSTGDTPRGHQRGGAACVGRDRSPRGGW